MIDDTVGPTGVIAWYYILQSRLTPNTAIDTFNITD